MKVTPEIITSIEALKGVKTQKQIAEDFGLSQGRVNQILLGRGPLTSEQRSASAIKRAQTCKVGRKRTLDYNTILELAEESLTYQEIADHVGCSVASVHRIINGEDNE